jgi:2-polyprenyl-3-methyl-5-hydroxy-6-metoxy-1,4-benzoquinol methylase
LIKNKYQDEQKNFTENRRRSWSRSASHPSKINLGGYYRRLIVKAYQNIIPENSTILEVGCNQGDLLQSLKPSIGVGIDFCNIAIAAGKTKYPNLTLIEGDAHSFKIPAFKFDYIILSDVINDVFDVQTVLENILQYCSSETRVVFNFYNHFWNIPLSIVRKIGLAKPVLNQNWLTKLDVKNILEISGFEPLKNWEEVIAPLYIPLISSFLNKYLGKIPPFSWLCLANFGIAKPNIVQLKENPTLSIVIAARNEAGHIDELLARLSIIPNNDEIIFVEGHSQDNTYDTIESLIPKYLNLTIKLIKQDGKGKGDAIRKGFDLATGDILLILDADITVPPEDIYRFYDLLASGKADFVNGVRLVYPMDEDAIRFANLVGNKFFSLAFSWLLGQPIRDTLCGTKALWAKDYARLKKNRAHFGDFDPFGDFDLLFGATYLNLKILEVPVRYRARYYGETNISRWSHGWLLLKMVHFASRKIKFVDN